MRKCAWFALCPNDAAGKVAHSVLGDVATCQTCADKHDLKLIKEDDDGHETFMQGLDSLRVGVAALDRAMRLIEEAGEGYWPAANAIEPSRDTLTELLRKIDEGEF